MLTAERLREKLSYDPETGLFTRLIKYKRRSKHRPQAVGRLSQQGYVEINVDQKRYKAHRLAWLYMTGAWPIKSIDHRDQVKDNNRWANLREATKAQNMQNCGVISSNTSGVRGVYWNKAAKKWQAYIKVDKQYTYLGLHETIESAAICRRAAELKLHKEFAPQVANG